MMVIDNNKNEKEIEIMDSMSKKPENDIKVRNSPVPLWVVSATSANQLTGRWEIYLQYIRKAVNLMPAIVDLLA